jgi:acyl-CoA thioesterase
LHPPPQLAAIIDLERLSRDLLQEKKEKRKLEARIREMNSQMLVGGVVDTQAFRSALAAVCHHLSIHPFIQLTIPHL